MLSQITWFWLLNKAISHVLCPGPLALWPVQDHPAPSPVLLTVQHPMVPAQPWDPQKSPAPTSPNRARRALCIPPRAPYEDKEEHRLRSSVSWNSREDFLEEGVSSFESGKVGGPLRPVFSQL